VKDGDGVYTPFLFKKDIKVYAGDDFTQILEEHFPVIMDGTWKAGYVTVEGKLWQNNRFITESAEQVLLKNRKSYRNDFQGKNIIVINWDAAEKALLEAGLSAGKFGSESQANSIVIAGEIPDAKTIQQILKWAKAGAKVILKFDNKWADALFENKILKEKVTNLGKRRERFLEW
jgi:hypothetical protein